MNIEEAFLIAQLFLNISHFHSHRNSMSEDEIHARSSVPDNGVADCLKAVEDYKGQNISKWEAISQIATAIQLVTASTDNKQQSTAGDTYLAMLDKHDNLLIRTSNQGQQGDRPDGGEERYKENTNGEARSKHSLSLAAPLNPSDESLMSPSMHGKFERKSPLSLYQQISNGPGPWSKTTPLISTMHSGHFSQPDLSLHSQSLNESRSSWEQWPTLTFGVEHG
jgi:hypothetical protein